MKHIILFTIAACSVLLPKAQFTTDYLRAADAYFKKADYYSAAQYYEKYLGTAQEKIKTDGYSPYTVAAGAKKNNVPVSSRQQALYHVAESYRLLHDHEKAAQYYEQALQGDAVEFPMARYYLAVELRALAKYEESEKAFNHFLDEHTNYDQYSESARKELMSLRFIQTQLRKKDLKYYDIQKAASPLNTEGANYAPAWLNDNTLCFTSTRADSSATKNHTHINRVYQASVSNGVPGLITSFELPQTNNMHQGVVSLTPDGNTLFCTRWTIQNGKKLSAIYSSHKTGTGWSEPVMLDSLINTPGFSAQQPFVMPDGKYLLYASDKTGGQGGFDLWYAALDANGKPVQTGNMGDVINSVNDEQAPYYHAASGTLVFSGNGRVGMGGFDFYYSKGTINRWNPPVNFGYPVNSVKDDIYFASKGNEKNILEDVWLSSDRAASCCLELFYLKKTVPKKQVHGQVIACADQSPLAGVTVNVWDTIQNKLVFTQRTGNNGEYALTLDEYQPLKVIAMADGYNRGELPFNEPADDPDADLLNNPAICLGKDVPPVETAVILENVYYDFDKATLQPASYAALDKLVQMMNDHSEIVIELSAHTDNIGNEMYNQRLSEARAKSCVAYLISKGIDPHRLQAKGYGATQPIAPNKHEDGSDDPEGRQQNRRTEFKILK